MLFIFSGQNTQLIPTTTGTLKITSEFLTTETNDPKRMNLFHQLLQVLWHKRCFWDIQQITSIISIHKKKTLTHFIHEQLFICPLWFLLFLNECWNILTNFFLLGAIIFIWSWGWLKMQSLWYIISYYQVVNLQSPSITWMQCMGLHWLWRQLPQGAHLEFLKLDPLTPLSVCTKNLFFFFRKESMHKYFILQTL